MSRPADAVRLTSHDEIARRRSIEGDEVDMTGIGTRKKALVAACVALAMPWLPSTPAGPAPLSAQTGDAAEGPDVHVGGLLRAGARVGPDGAGRDDGFEIFDARLRSSGEIGIVFDYFLQAGFDSGSGDLRLLDARLSLPIVPEATVELGQFKAPFGREALQGKGEVTFVERSQATQLLAPGRQVGVQVAGEALDQRLSYRGGVFNGNGTTLDNVDDSFLYAARVSYNTVGPAQFYDELVIEVGANVAVSSDSAARLAGLAEPAPAALTGADPRLNFADYRGDRFLWGADLRASFRGYFLRGEYLRGEFDPDVALRGPGPVRSTGDVVVDGVSVEGGYSLWGAVEGVVRLDALSGGLEHVEGVPVTEDVLAGGSGETRFLVFGLNLFPGYYTKVGLQYAVGLGGTRRGPGLSDGEFSLVAQVDF